MHNATALCECRVSCVMYISPLSQHYYRPPTHTLRAQRTYSQRTDAVTQHSIAGAYTSQTIPANIINSAAIWQSMALKLLIARIVSRLRKSHAAPSTEQPVRGAPSDPARFSGASLTHTHTFSCMHACHWRLNALCTNLQRNATTIKVLDYTAYPSPPPHTPIFSIEFGNAYILRWPTDAMDLCLLCAAALGVAFKWK